MYLLPQSQFYQSFNVHVNELKDMQGYFVTLPVIWAYHVSYHIIHDNSGILIFMIENLYFMILTILWRDDVACALVRTRRQNKRWPKAKVAPLPLRKN